MHKLQRLRGYLVFGVVSLMCWNNLAHAQEAREEAVDPVHQELRKLREKAVTAFKAKDIDSLLECLDENIVATLQNGEAYVGHDGVRKFHKRMSEGADRTVKSQETTFNVDDLSFIHNGDAAVARGTLDDHFVLTNEMEFDLKSRWSATVIKEGDHWLVASFHASANMFDNGVSDLMLKWNTLKFGGLGLLGGVIGTALVMRAIKPRPSQGAA
jgi:ketosteroid isomerase-like protein